MRFKLALISKGLRHLFAVEVIALGVFQACPDFKGIKTNYGQRRRFCQRFKLALISKGLRRLAMLWLCCTRGFKLALISKGLRLRLEITPCKGFCFKLALISKGLRPGVAFRVEVPGPFQACPDFKGIKTSAKTLALFRAPVSSLP